MLLASAMPSRRRPEAEGSPLRDEFHEGRGIRAAQGVEDAMPVGPRHARRPPRSLRSSKRGRAMAGRPRNSPTNALHCRTNRTAMPSG